MILISFFLEGARLYMQERPAHNFDEKYDSCVYVLFRNTRHLFCYSVALPHKNEAVPAAFGYGPHYRALTRVQTAMATAKT